MSLDLAVSGAQSNLALGAVELNLASAGMNVHTAVDGPDVHAAIACFDLEIGIRGHADFDLERAVVVETENTRLVPEPGIDFHTVGVLTAADGEVAVDLIPAVFDPD